MLLFDKAYIDGPNGAITIQRSRRLSATGWAITISQLTEQGITEIMNFPIADNASEERQEALLKQAAEICYRICFQSPYSPTGADRLFQFFKACREPLC